MQQQRQLRHGLIGRKFCKVSQMVGIKINEKRNNEASKKVGDLDVSFQYCLLLRIIAFHFILQFAVCVCQTPIRFQLSHTIWDSNDFVNYIPRKSFFLRFSNEKRFTFCVSSMMRPYDLISLLAGLQESKQLAALAGLLVAPWVNHCNNQLCWLV